MGLSELDRHGVVRLYCQIQQNLQDLRAGQVKPGKVVSSEEAIA